MKFTPSKIMVGIATGALAFSSMAYAEEATDATEVQAIQVPEQVQQIFVPIVTGAPVVRVGGGSRGKCGDLGEDIVLDAQPLSWSDSPTLSWSTNKAVSGTFVFKLGEAPNKNWDLVKPLVDETMELSTKEGEQSLSLTNYKVSLKEGVEYEWFLSLVCDSENRSKDIIVATSVASTGSRGPTP
jgi:hypothetical protein